MNRLLLLLSVLIVSGCVTKKKKTDVSKVKKFYHNVTSEYNGYFNANELVVSAMESLKGVNVDNYTKIIELYDYVSPPDPKIVNAEMDKVVEKVTRVSLLHEPGDWVDDCYVMMGKAQYLKGTYQTAVETFEFFEQDFNPANPYGRNFQKRKLSKSDLAKQKKKERKQNEKEREEKIKDTEKKREETKKEREEEREAAAKARKKASNNKSKSKERPPRTKPSTEPKPTTITTNKPANVVDTAKVNAATVAQAPSSITQKDEDKTAYNEGLVWLAKSYIRAKQYTSAEFLLNRLEKISFLKPEVSKELYAAQADLMIKTNRLGKSLEYIDLALESKASRSEKARYAFVAGQILMANGEYKKAQDYFSISKKRSIDNKMKFMSELNVIKCDYIGRGGDPKSVIAKLEKMLKETKYAEFRDQIHFAYGDIAGANKDITTAKEQYSLSVAANSSDNSLKGEAYFRIAEINLNIEDYVGAKNYYDSTLTVMSNLDERYRKVEGYAQNLTDIAKNITAIAKIDTAMTIAGLSEQERYKVAKKRFEEENKAGAPTASKPAADNTGLIKNTGGSRAVISDYWAYNSISSGQGQITFKNKWGDRPLTDNWRIKSKITSNASNNDSNVASSDSSYSGIKNDDMSQDEYDRLMADIPKSSLDKSKLLDERTKLSASLGKAFRDKLEKYKKSADVLEPLELKVTTGYDIAEIYYYLYLDYRDLGNVEKMNYYKNLMAKDFPESKFTKIANEDGYAAKLADESKRLDRYYDQTYEAFQKGQYEQVSTMVFNASETFGVENKLVAKFTLLNAMALGYIKGQQAYIDALNEVITRYPNSAEGTKAKEIKRLLQGDTSAFKSADEAEVNELFSNNDQARHYVAVIIFNNSDDVLQRAKISVAEYNKKYNSTDRLQMSDVILNQTEGLQLILVRHFSNKEKAMTYYEGVNKSKNEFIPEILTNYEVYPITQENYRKLIQERSHNKYRSFFQTTYLGQ